MASNSLEKVGSPGEVEPVQVGAVVSYNPDAPSEEWGWHGHWSEFAPRGRNILLGLGVFGLLALTIGNHESHVEDYFLVVIAMILLGYIIHTNRKAKRKRRIKP